MSWTPTFLIEKDSFDKAFESIKDKVDNYWSDRRDFYSWYNDKVHEKCKEYESVVLECGGSVNKTKIHDKVEKELKESEGYKLKSESLLREDNLSVTFEYHNEDKCDFEICDLKFYYFNTDYSSQAKALEKFLEENNVKFNTTH